MNEIYEFLKKCGTYYIATMEGDQPRVRPFGTVNLFDGKIYIQTGKSKNVFKQIQINPKVEICAMYQNCWIRISTILVEDDRIESQESMLEAYPNLKSMYVPGDGNNVVFYMTNTIATIESFGKDKKTLKF